MYGKNQYPYLPGSLVSPLFSHRGFHSATSSTLIDFTCRNTWTFDDVETLRRFSPSENFNTTTRAAAKYRSVEHFPMGRRFQPVVIYPLSRGDPSHIPIFTGSLREPPCFPVFRETQLKHFSYRRSSDSTSHLSIQSHETVNLNQDSETLPGLSLALHSPSLARHGLSLAQHSIRDTRHRCPFCHVTCSNKGQMKGHLRVHTGEKPYSCDQIGCGKAFARNEELTRHRRIHSGQKPYPCGQCGKRFGRKDHLNKHKKTHLQTKEKIFYTCDFPECKHKFTRSDALTRHRCNSHEKQL